METPIKFLTVEFMVKNRRSDRVGTRFLTVRANGDKEAERLVKAEMADMLFDPKTVTIVEVRPATQAEIFMAEKLRS